MNIALVVVAYNRVDSVCRLLRYLDVADYGGDSPTLIISIDKSNTDVVEKFADEYQWNHGAKIVDKHEENLGLRNHMLSLGKWFEKFDAIVVLEDDIVVSPMFYHYVSQTVEKYHKDQNVAGISLYNFEVNYQTGNPFVPIKDEHDVYFMNCAMSWGEVWMKDSWLRFNNWYKDHEDFVPSEDIPEVVCKWGKKSWLKYHTRYCIENDLYFVYPYTSLSSNFSDAGEHNEDVKTAFQTCMQYGEKKNFVLPTFSKSSIKYDGFFEYKGLASYLGYKIDEVCFDLNGSKRNMNKYRYWLTIRKTELPIIREYGIRLRPLEANILNGVEGQGVYLYEVSRSANIGCTNSYVILYRHHIDSILAFIEKVGFYYIFSQFFTNFINKVKKWSK